jgi:hypothetical protein
VPLGRFFLASQELIDRTVVLALAQALLRLVC